MSCLLHAAEALEAEAALERVAYWREIDALGATTLDAGCGNGYSVREMRERGVRAIGVDYSLYRMSRWLAEQRPHRWLVVADAGALPFRTRAFETVVSSGMLEHIGVIEQTQPYRVASAPDQAARRQRTIDELRRVSTRTLTLDFPNGAFPVDFWHGESIGAFRVHAIPDPLNPTFAQIRSYVAVGSVTLLPLRNRLRFRQISTSLWGRLLKPLARVTLRVLDRLPRSLPLLSLFYPYLVIRIDPAPEPGTR